VTQSLQVKTPELINCTIIAVKDAEQRAAGPNLTGLIHLPLPYLATFGGFLISLLMGGIGLVGNEQGFLFVSLIALAASQCGRRKSQLAC
jgi:hypothetical protein